MDTALRKKIEQYVKNQLAQADNRLYAYTVDQNTNELYPKRELVTTIEQYIRDYQQKGSEPRSVTVAGLRGVGKTTLMAQLYREVQCEQYYKLYISVDELIKVLGVSLQDVLTVYEEILGVVFEKLEKPVYLFFDEIHYEEKWSAILKSIYDRSRKVFVVTTGSAALLLQPDTDMSRRAALQKLYPLSFSEMILIKEKKQQPKTLSERITQSIFTASTAEEIYTHLQTLQQEVTHYWLGFDRLAIDTYLRYATLPFTLQFKNEALIYDQIEKSLNSIISADIPRLKKFDAETISKINSILYAISSADIVSLKKLSEMFDLAINTLIDILDTCAKAELLLRVYPYGTHYSQVRKPSKYLFLSSAYRSMFFNLIGSQTTYESYKGFLLEDVVGLYLQRILSNQIGTAITYDNAEGGADFIIHLQGRKIPLEVGHGEKGYEQIVTTMKRINAPYGIIVSSAKLKLSEDKNMVSIPLEYFLLI
jgi:predicted AAA+ superfamily ATPase